MFEVSAKQRGETAQLRRDLVWAVKPSVLLRLLKLTSHWGGSLQAEVAKMGGINHKPTKGTKLVASAARVSRVVGMTLETILAANTAYEEAIIAAFNGSYDEALSHHSQSLDLAATAQRRLRDIDAAYAMMLEDIAIEKYPGNPLAPGLELDVLRKELSGRVLLDLNTVLFDAMANAIKAQNLVETFKQERAQFAKVEKRFGPYLDALRESRDRLENSAHDPRVWVHAVDEGEVPIHSTYLALLTGFLGAFQRFVYSTAISTDLYYKTEGYGNLINEGAAVRR